MDLMCLNSLKKTLTWKVFQRMPILRIVFSEDNSGNNMGHYVAVEFCNLKFNGVIAIQPAFVKEGKTESKITLVEAQFLNMKITDIFWKSFLSDGLYKDHSALNVFGPKIK